MLNRDIFIQLQNWKNQNNRKPLVLKGARQVGKSYIVEHFAKKEFKNFHCVNFQSNRHAHSIFSDGHNLTPQEIINDLGHLLGRNINPETDLLFFDEIQECPHAINSCKFFNEQMPNLALIAAGSYLGLMDNQASFPVGKVTFLSMFPLTFSEFLKAINPPLYEHFDSINVVEMSPLKTLYHNDLHQALKLYNILGGMPEVVSSFVKARAQDGEVEALIEARRLQLDLIQGYIADFAKHAGAINASHLLHVFNSVPTQLSKSYDDEVSKFKFQGVIPKQRGFERIRGPLDWLSQSRLVIKSRISCEALQPLSSYTTENKFKLYFFDIGLLNTMLDIPLAVLTQEELGSYKGFIAENFVAQELFARFDKDLISWQKGKSEIEFLIQKDHLIIPLEVKSSKRSARAKSLYTFIEKYSPQIAYKLSGQNYGYNPDKRLTTLPLYLVSKI